MIWNLLLCLSGEIFVRCYSDLNFTYLSSECMWYPRLMYYSEILETRKYGTAVGSRSIRMSTGKLWLHSLLLTLPCYGQSLPCFPCYWSGLQSSEARKDIWSQVVSVRYGVHSGTEPSKWDVWVGWPWPLLMVCSQCWIGHSLWLFTYCMFFITCHAFTNTPHKQPPRLNYVMPLPIPLWEIIILLSDFSFIFSDFPFYWK